MKTTEINPSFKSILNLMKLTFGIVPIVAGIDKFTNLLTQWSHYISPDFAAALPFTPETLMMIVGVIEIVAGIIVLAKPSIGGYIVSAWLTLIGLLLLASGNHLDVAVRDLVMAVGAFSLARMAAAFQRVQVRY